MKKLLITLLLGIFIALPALASDTMASRLQGKILLAVEDHGKTYYVNEGQRYRIDKDTAHNIFEKLALGITNADLELIPEGSVGIDPVSSCSPVTVYSTVTCEPAACEPIECEVSGDEDLQEDYLALQEDYESLRSEYSELEDLYQSTIKALEDAENAVAGLTEHYSSLETTYNELYESYIDSELHLCRLELENAIEGEEYWHNGHDAVVDEMEELEDYIHVLEQCLLHGYCN